MACDTALPYLPPGGFDVFRLMSLPVNSVKIQQSVCRRMNTALFIHRGLGFVQFGETYVKRPEKKVSLDVV